jgi:hypothetical protein
VARPELQMNQLLKIENKIVSAQPIDQLRPIPPEVLREFSEQMQAVVDTSLAKFLSASRQVARFFDPTFRPGPVLSWESVLLICRIRDRLTRIKSQKEARAFSSRAKIVSLFSPLGYSVFHEYLKKSTYGQTRSFAGVEFKKKRQGGCHK